MSTLYCFQCSREYVEDVLECVECGVPLVEEEPTPSQEAFARILARDVDREIVTVHQVTHRALLSGDRRAEGSGPEVVFEDLRVIRLSFGRAAAALAYMTETVRAERTPVATTRPMKPER